jgi:hypothetical protein
VVVLILLFIVGIRIMPRAFPKYASESRELQTRPLPDDLPAPVDRFYRTIYGDHVPVIETAVVSGRMDRLRIMGINFKGRFRFVYNAGEDYRHYLENTIFGIPLFKVNEYYLEGKARMELPFGTFEGPTYDQGANLGLWAEMVWMPSVFITDPRVSWEAVDDETAILGVPFGEQKQHFIARFDSETGLLHMLESMRFKGGEERKTLWINQVRAWDTVDGHRIPSSGVLTWLDEGTPWAIFNVEELVYNREVSEYIRAKGY